MRLIGKYGDLPFSCVDIRQGIFSLVVMLDIETGVISIYQIGKKKSQKDVSFYNLCLSGYLRPFMGDTQ